jgi:hypothetical protein
MGLGFIANQTVELKESTQMKDKKSVHSGTQLSEMKVCFQATV